MKALIPAAGRSARFAPFTRLVPGVKLTCATATYNVIQSGNRAGLIRCIESVAALKTEHEHFVFDGASKDGTTELLSELAAKTPGLVVVSEPDTGIYSALNKAVQVAQGEWFHVLGADDYVCDPATLDRLIADLEPCDDAVATTVRTGWGRLWFTDLKELGGLFDGACVCHQGELMRTALIRKLGGFDERYRIAADSDLFFKAHYQGRRFRYSFETFAYFASGGFAEQHLEEALRENRDCVAVTLGLTGDTRRRVVDECWFPLGLALRLAFHGDLAIRKSAWRKIKQRIKGVLT